MENIPIIILNNNNNDDILLNSYYIYNYNYNNSNGIRAVVYFPALESLEIRIYEEVLRILEELLEWEIDNYQIIIVLVTAII